MVVPYAYGQTLFFPCIMDLVIGPLVNINIVGRNILLFSFFTTLKKLCPSTEMEGRKKALPYVTLAMFSLITPSRRRTDIACGCGGRTKCPVKRWPHSRPELALGMRKM